MTTACKMMSKERVIVYIYTNGCNQCQPSGVDESIMSRDMKVT